MGFPTLNEMLNAIQQSQQNAFVDPYFKARDEEQNRRLQEQKIAEIMQKMELEKAMQPYDIKSKEAAASLNSANATNIGLSNKEKELKTTLPNYQESLSAEQEKPINDANAARLKQMTGNIEYNNALAGSAAIQSFFNDPTLAKAIATSPELTAKKYAIDQELKAAGLRAGGGGAKNPTAATLVRQAIDDIYKYGVFDKKTNSWKPKDAESYVPFNKALTTWQYYGSQQTTTDNGLLPPTVKSTVKGGGSGETTHGKVDAQGRIHLED